MAKQLMERGGGYAQESMPRLKLCPIREPEYVLVGGDPLHCLWRSYHMEKLPPIGALSTELSSAMVPCRIEYEEAQSYIIGAAWKSDHYEVDEKSGDVLDFGHDVVYWCYMWQKTE